MASTRKRGSKKMVNGGGFLIGCLVLFTFLVYSTPAFSQMGGKIKLRMSNGLAPTTFQNAVLLPEFAQEVEKKSNGRAIVELYPAKQLYGHIATAHAVHRGAIEAFSSEKSLG